MVMTLTTIIMAAAELESTVESTTSFQNYESEVCSSSSRESVPSWTSDESMFEDGDCPLRELQLSQGAVSFALSTSTVYWTFKF